MFAKPWINLQDFELLNRRASSAANRLREVCGAFHSDANGRLRIRYLVNRYKDVGSFRLQLRDLRFVEEKGPYWGTFHSHPISDASPSEADLENAFGMVLIYSDLKRDLRLWIPRRHGLIECNVMRLSRQRRVSA